MSTRIKCNTCSRRAGVTVWALVVIGAAAVVGLVVCVLAVFIGNTPGDEAPPSSSARPTVAWFVEPPTQVAKFKYHTGAVGQLHMPEIMAGGVALFDYDNDGDLDIYLANGNNLLPSGKRSPVDTNMLFARAEDGSYMDVTTSSKLGDGGFSMGAAIGDYDNDGHVDVYVTNYGADRLYHNHQDHTFREVTAAAGITGEGWSASAAFFDYDRDGWLDLYVTQYVEYEALKKCTDPAGAPDYCSPKSYKPLHDVLWHNGGDGTFTDVSATAGLTAIPACAGLGVITADFDRDGWQDVYVANDGYPNQLWRNRGDGTFEDVAMVYGIAFNAMGAAEAGMGVTAADFDNDTFVDLFMTHLAAETNTYYRNLGGRGFEDATAASGLGSDSLARTGFGTAAFDAELDGDLDLLVANGRVARSDTVPSDATSPWSWFAEPNLFFINDGTGRFEATSVARALTDEVAVSRGLAAGDLDDDGDVDVVLSNIEAPARIYLNEAPRQGNWLGIRAVDPALRRVAIGARVVVTSGTRTWTRVVTRASSYLSNGDPRVHFGLGAVDTVDAIRVYWPDGTAEHFRIKGLNGYITLERGQGEALP